MKPIQSCTIPSRLPHHPADLPANRKVRVINLTLPILKSTLQICQLSHVPRTPCLISQRVVIHRELTQLMAHKEAQLIQLLTVNSWSTLQKVTLALACCLSGENSDQSILCGHLLGWSLATIRTDVLKSYVRCGLQLCRP